MILSLQKFDSICNIKKDCLINFEDKLDLVDYLDKDILPNTERKYKLYGVVYHTGNLRFGHYYACINIGLNDQ